MRALFEILKEANIDTRLAKSNKVILSELAKLSKATEENIKNMTIEQSIKTILWQGILNKYGVFSPKKEELRRFVKKGVPKIYYRQQYQKGQLLSIDYGTSNIGKEFCLTHTSIVLYDFPGFVVVIPLTSQKDKQLNNLPQEIRDVIIPIYKTDYSILENDSYILVHQIKSVSKNRITKEIGSLTKTEIMNDIENTIYNIFSSYIKKVNEEHINSLKNEIEELTNIINNYENKFGEI